MNAEQSVGWGNVPVPFALQNASISAGGSVGPAGVVDWVVGGDWVVWVVPEDVVAFVVDFVVDFVVGTAVGSPFGVMAISAHP